MGKQYLKLQNTEGYVVQAAANIYAAYISAGRVEEGSEAQWIKRSIKEALQIAKATDAIVVADEEMG